jgi:hypothetical protein
MSGHSIRSSSSAARAGGLTKTEAGALSVITFGD